MKKYDIPINFKVYAETENKGIDKVMRMIRLAIVEYALENEITDYDLFEFIPTPNEQACCLGC